MVTFNCLNHMVLQANAPPMDRQGRGKRSIALNLKSSEGLTVVHKLCSNADVIIEPFRPGKAIYKKLDKCPIFFH